MSKAAEILGKGENTENLGSSLAWLAVNYGPENYKSVDKANKEVLYIQTGHMKSTTFKIKVNDLVFSSLW